MARRVTKLVLLCLDLMLFASAPAAILASNLPEGQEPAVLPDSGFEKLVQTKIDEHLLPHLGSAELTTVIVYLKEQPRPGISKQVRSEHESSLSQISSEIAAIHARYRQIPTTGTVDEERALARQEMAAISKSDSARIRQLHLKAREVKDRIRQETNRQTQAAIAESQDALVSAVQAMGGRVIYRYSLINGVAARAPGEIIRAIADLPFVLFVLADKEFRAQLNVSAPTIRAEAFWDADPSKTGGIWRSATLDTGVDTLHPGLSGHTWTSQTFHAAAVDASNYNDDSTTTDDLQGHGTHVAGIQVSTDSTYQGISFGSTRHMNLKAGYLNTSGRGSMQWSDMMAAVDWAINHSYDPDAINYSFGAYDGSPIGDTAAAQFWDAVVDDEVCPVAISAGNDGSAAQTLGDPGTAYNVLCVANVNDMDTTSRADDAINAGSSRGPTADGRKKPDIAAPGTSILSAAHNWEGTNPNYVGKTGTSMAAPHITAAMVLLHDVGVYDNKTIKAILINTAEDLGDAGWDSAYGWGYVDLEHVYAHRTDRFVSSVTPRGALGDFKLYKTTGMTAGEKATLVWHRRAVYNGSNYPTTYYTLSDLNLRLYDETNGDNISYSLSGKDNVEQVVSDRSTTQVIKVYAWSTGFDGASSEPYALATEENTAAVNGPSLSCVPVYSDYTPPEDAKFEVMARTYNSGDLAAHNCTTTISVPSGMTLISGAVSQNVGTAAAGGYSSYATWILRADTASQKTVNLSVSSSSYAETWTGSGSFTVTPEAPDTVDPITVMRIGNPNYLTSGSELVTNGGFESNFTGWTTSGSVSISTSIVHSGSKAAYIGMGTGNASSIRQNISIPLARPVILSLWYRTARSGGWLNFTSQRIEIRKQSDNSTLALLLSEQSSHDWQNLVIDLTKFRGQDVYLYCHVTSSVFGGYSDLWIDDVSIKTNGKVWVKSYSDLTLIASDDRAGVDYSQYWIDSGPWVSGEVFNLSTPGEQYVYYRSADNSGNIESYTYLSMGMDETAPGTPVVSASPSTTSTTSLSASWSATDSESGIVEYQYAIGTSPGAANIVGWTTTTSTSAIRTGLSLSYGSIYYWSVKAKNGADMWSGVGVSSGTRVCRSVSTVAEARGYPDGTWVALPAKSVSASFSSSFYIEETNKSCGVRVVWPSPPPENAYATVAGQIGTSYAEREIAAVSVSYSAGPAVEPIGMRHKDLAGTRFNSYEQQVPGAKGPNNVGLSVKVWGRVTKVYAGDFYMDDGSQVMDSSPTVGVLVDTWSIGVIPPAVNQIVEVTGISGVTTLGGIPIRIVRPRRASDIVVLGTPVAYIYRIDQSLADSFKALLDSNKLITDVLSTTDAETADFSKYNLIIIGNDTGSGNVWGTAAAVTNISRSGKPVLGIGDGGYAFFGKLGLDIGYPNGASFSESQMYSLNPASTIYSTPNHITVPLDQVLTLYSSTVSTKAIYLPSIPAGVEVIGRKIGSTAYYPLLREDSRYMLWSYGGTPTLMTSDGWKLFINAAWHAMR